MKQILETYAIKGKEKTHLFDDFDEFEKIVNSDDLIDLLKNPYCVIFEAERRTKIIEVEDDWTVMR